VQQTDDGGTAKAAGREGNGGEEAIRREFSMVHASDMSETHCG
jgi:hypothetical protein